jgi:hypothetical protein
MRCDSSELVKFFQIVEYCSIKTFFVSLLVPFFHLTSALPSPSSRDGLVKLKSFCWESLTNSILASTRLSGLNKRSETKENKKFFIIFHFLFFWWSSKPHQKNRVLETQKNHLWFSEGLTKQPKLVHSYESILEFGHWEPQKLNRLTKIKFIF